MTEREAMRSKRPLRNSAVNAMAFHRVPAGSANALGTAMTARRLSIRATRRYPGTLSRDWCSTKTQPSYAKLAEALDAFALRP